MATANIYLTFNGNCEEVFTFYKSVFGSEYSTFSRFSDVPSEHTLSDEDAKKIMHVSLPIGEGTALMASDTTEGMGKVSEGTNFAISISTDSEAEATKLFMGISAGGKVTMPLAKTFWNAYFGMCTDRFGVQWMVNYDYK